MPLAPKNTQAGFALTTTLLIFACSSTPDETPILTANTIHERALVIDAHAHPKPGAEASLSLGEKTAGFELDFLTMKEGGLDAVFFSLPMLSDFLGSEYHTTGLESAAGLPSITSTLLERGYSQEEVAKFLGGNLLRVFETVLGGDG